MARIDTAITDRIPRSLWSQVQYDTLLFLSYFTGLLLLFHSAVLTTYEFSDSYTALQEGLQHQLWYIFDAQMFVYGRPVNALLFQLGFSSVQTIDDLRWLRLVSLIGIAALAWLIHRALRRASIGQLPAVTIPLILCTLPAFEVWASWAVCAFYPWAAALSGASFSILESGFARRGHWHGWLLCLVAIALLLLSICIYQPGAMVFLIFVAIALMSRDSTRSSFRRLGACLALLLVAIGVDFILARTLPGLLYGDEIVHVPGISSNRTMLVSDVGGKVAWFFHEPLLSSLNLWNLLPSVELAWIVGVACSLGTVLFLRGALPWRLLKLLTLLLLVPLAYLPNLFVQENWASYRSQAALSALIALYLCCALVGVARTLEPLLLHFQIQGTRLATALPLCLLLIGANMAAWNVSATIVTPQQEELAFVASQLKTPALSKATSIYVIPCAWTDTIAPLERYDEFGLPSCGQPWAPEPMVWLLLRAYHPEDAGLPIVVTNSGAITPPAGSLVVDLRLLQQLRMQPPQYK